MTVSPWLAAICERRWRNFPVGMPATSPRNPRPRLPLEGRLPVCSRPWLRASAKSRFSITTAALRLLGDAEQLRDGLAQVPVTGAGGQVSDLEGGREGTADGIAGGVHHHRCEPAGVHVDRHDGGGPEVFEAGRGDDRQLPGGI